VTLSLASLANRTQKCCDMTVEWLYTETAAVERSYALLTLSCHELHCSCLRAVTTQSSSSQASSSTAGTQVRLFVSTASANSGFAARH
jgi:hypothetical protein